MKFYHSVRAEILARARSNGHPEPNVALQRIIKEISSVVEPRIYRLDGFMKDFSHEAQNWYPWRFDLAIWIAFFGDEARDEFPGIEPERPKEYKELCAVFEDLSLPSAQRSKDSSINKITRLTSEDLQRVELQDKETGEWVLFEEWERRTIARERKSEREKVCGAILKKFDERVTPMLERHRREGFGLGYQFRR